MFSSILLKDTDLTTSCLLPWARKPLQTGTKVKRNVSGQGSHSNWDKSKEKGPWARKPLQTETKIKKKVPGQGSHFKLGQK